MLKIRCLFVALGMFLSSSVYSAVQLSIGIGLPNVSIGINLPAYPELVRVPGYPVYYAPRLDANFFFYDSLYWVYQDDNWYASSWYNGPWGLVGPEAVPLFVLRIPVRFYRQPPAYFFGWRPDAPPRWGHHWGREWEQRRRGWDKWDRRAVPAAPLPAYQRQYSGDRYPRQMEQQQELQQQHYRYQPRDPVVRQHYQERAWKRAPAQQERRGAPEERGDRQRDMQRFTPRQQDDSATPRSQPPQRGDRDVQRSIPASPQQGRGEAEDRRQSPEQRDRRDQQMPRSQARDERQYGKDATREPRRKQEQEQERGRDRDRDRGRNE